MNRTILSLSLLLSTAATMRAQQSMVLLDPARGGSMGGGHIAEHVEEKQVTLDTARRLASLLRARGFDVELTRDTDTDTTNDQRAALANTTHPIACVLLHATSTGMGVHLYTTSLHQGMTDGPALWDQAQAAYADRSHALANELSTAFTRSKIPVSTGSTWMRPLDNMQCSAVAVEIAPQKNGEGADDPTYQGHVADVIANAMIFWRGKVAALAPPPPPPKPAAPVAAKPDASAVKTTTAVKPDAAKTPATPKPATAAKPVTTPGTATGTTPAAPKAVKPKPAPTPAAETP